MTTVYTFVNHKGGVGKTTTTIILAHLLAIWLYRVLIVDLDPQGHCATTLNVEPNQNAFNLLVTGQPPSLWVQPTGRENLWIIPGNNMTSAAQAVMTATNKPISAIRDVLKPLFKDFDYIFLDTAPSTGGIQERAIWAADRVIIPTATEFLALDGLKKVVSMTVELHERGWKGKIAGVLPTFFDEQTNQSKTAMAQLSEAFGNRLLPPIHRATVLRECAAEGVTIFEKDPKSRAALEYTAVADYLRKLA